jgi:hypothetical protein
MDADGEKYAGSQKYAEATKRHAGVVMVSRRKIRGTESHD